MTAELSANLALFHAAVEGGVLGTLQVAPEPGEDTLWLHAITHKPGSPHPLEKIGVNLPNRLHSLDGNDVVVGNGGNDFLMGGTGHDLVIGGAGQDEIHRQEGEDLLIGGTTTYDTDLVSLGAIRREWTRQDLSYQQRVNHLMNRGATTAAWSCTVRRCWTTEPWTNFSAKTTATGSGTIRSTCWTLSPAS